MIPKFTVIVIAKISNSNEKKKKRIIIKIKITIPTNNDNEKIHIWSREQNINKQQHITPATSLLPAQFRHGVERKEKKARPAWRSNQWEAEGVLASARVRAWEPGCGYREQHTGEVMVFAMAWIDGVVWCAVAVFVFVLEICDVVRWWLWWYGGIWWDKGCDVWWWYGVMFLVIYDERMMLMIYSDDIGYKDICNGI